MTCMLIFLGQTLLAVHCLPPAPDIWIEPEQRYTVAYMPRPPHWGFG